MYIVLEFTLFSDTKMISRVTPFFDLQAKDQKTIEDIAQKLKENEIKHKLWTEQPENYPTCLALKPYPKDDVHKFLKKLKLFK